MRRKLMLWAIVSLFALMATLSLQAQVTTATVTGNIKDTSGAVVLGAEITATNVDTNLARATKSNDLGEYRIEFLPVGSYTISVAAQGFNKYVQKGIVLGINQTARIDATLKLGTVSEVIEVTSAAPLVNTNSAEIGQTIENVQLNALPIVGRNAYSLLDITPGVQQNTTTGLTLGFPEQKTLINGGSDGNYTGTVNYFLDGATSMTGLRSTGNVLPNPDAIQEFRVQTNAYSAEYGRFANGVVNAVTKSGTNDFHGSAFDFYRNDALNAYSWGQSAKGPLHRNQFGATFGGPIRKDKTFFFGSYAGLRQITSPTLQGVVPTAAELPHLVGGTMMSDFSASLIKPKNFAAGGAAYTCTDSLGVVHTNAICQSAMDPVALHILQTYVPAANTTPTANNVNNYQGYIVTPDDRNDILAKIDHQLTSKDMLTGSFFTTAGVSFVNGGSSATSGGGNVPYSQQQFKWRQTNLIVSDTHTISPTMVNQAWLLYTRMMGGRTNLPATSLDSMGSSFLTQGTPSLPQIAVTGFFQMTSMIAGPKAGTNLYAARDVLSITKGRHNIRLGGEFSLEKDDQQTLLNNYGVFTFDTNAKLTTSPYANFLLGIPTSIKQDAPVWPSTSTYNTAMFVQDDFRVRPRLTLNLGLRWDIQTPPVDSANRLSTFIPGEQSVVRPTAPVGEVFPGDPGVTRGIIPVRWGHVSPRFGFAFDPFGDGKTSIRGAAGLFWGSVSGNEWNQSSNFQPFATRLTLTNVLAFDPTTKAYTGGTLSNPYQGYVGGVPFPYNGQFVNGGSPLGVSPGFDWPYTYQLNFSVQRQFTSTMSASVAYVGSITHNLPFSMDINYPNLQAAGASTSGANVQSRRPNQNFGSIYLTESNQASWYHSLQVTATKKMSHNVNFTSSYVWSKTMCTAEIQGGSTNVAQDMSNLNGDRGPCDSDVRHALNIAMVYQPNYYHGEQKVIGHILNGWEVSPIIKARSGSPFSILNGADANLDGSSSYDRAQLVGDPYLANPSITEWFNTAAFAQNPAVTGKSVDGNSPRNFLYGPASLNVDMALSRTFKFTERFKLQFRGEATNIFNIVNLNNPGASMSNMATFGKISGASAMRQVQLGLRLTF
jgi:hypothetical protein